jgi:hypothetical protein
MPPIDIKAAAEVVATLELVVIGIIWALYQKALADVKIVQEREVARSETMQADCKVCLTKLITENADLATLAVRGLEQNSAALLALKNDLRLYESLTKLGKKKVEGVG